MLITSLALDLELDVLILQYLLECTFQEKIELLLLSSEKIGGSAQDPKNISPKSRKIPRMMRAICPLNRKPSRAMARQHSQFCCSIARIDAPVPQHLQ
eukprot:scaffold3737_cov72-Cyclotella_meneghiniana.AAC.1